MAESAEFEQAAEAMQAVVEYTYDNSDLATVGEIASEGCMAQCVSPGGAAVRPTLHTHENLSAYSTERHCSTSDHMPGREPDTTRTFSS